jgi:hypothetical protein
MVKVHYMNVGNITVSSAVQFKNKFKIYLEIDPK